MCPTDENVHGADGEKRRRALTKTTLNDECAMQVARILARLASREDERAKRSPPTSSKEWYELHPDRSSEIKRD